MDTYTQSARIIITCHKRAATFLEKEVRTLGYEPVHVFQTGVILMGTMSDCIRLNLNLFCASQVLYSLQRFRLNNPDELYEHASRIEWEKLLSSTDYFSVTSNVFHPTINNSLFANLKVKDAIADRLRDFLGTRPDTGSELLKAVIHLFWKEEEGELFIETAGPSLGKHGYRKIPGKAPMLEALTAATISAMKWDGSTPFINPMCGSGTVAIEAALHATNRRPGLFRKNYSFMHFDDYQPEVYEEQRQLLEDQVVEKPHLKIVATDISDDALKITKLNAAAAGVDQYMTFDVCDFEETDVPEGAGGVIYFNPEYGERLGEIAQLEETYARIGDFMKKKCKGYTGYIFTGNLDLAKKIGLKASRRVEFYSAKLDCRLLEYELYGGTKRVAKEVEDAGV